MFDLDNRLGAQNVHNNNNNNNNDALAPVALVVHSENQGINHAPTSELRSGSLLLLMLCNSCDSLKRLLRRTNPDPD